MGSRTLITLYEDETEKASSNSFTKVSKLYFVFCGLSNSGTAFLIASSSVVVGVGVTAGVLVWVGVGVGVIGSSQQGLK